MELVKPAALQVQRERERLSLTPQQLASALGVHERTIMRWEAGEFAPHPVYLERMSKMQLQPQQEKVVSE
jgi:DNA-binding transcriptional regulator YiaG